MASFAQYAKEFDDPYKDCLIKPETLAKTEMIAPQLDDPFIEDLEEQVAKIYSVVEFDKIRDNELLAGHREVKNAVKTINRLVYERFGFNFNMVFAEGAFFACLPCPPKAYNELNRNLLSNVRQAKKAIETEEKRDQFQYDKADEQKNNDLLTSGVFDDTGFLSLTII